MSQRVQNEDFVYISVQFLRKIFFSFLIHLQKVFNVVVVKTSVDSNVNQFILNRKHTLGTALIFVIEIPIKRRKGEISLPQK